MKQRDVNWEVNWEQLDSILMFWPRRRMAAVTFKIQSSERDSNRVSLYCEAGVSTTL